MQKLLKHVSKEKIVTLALVIVLLMSTIVPVMAKTTYTYMGSVIADSKSDISVHFKATSKSSKVSATLYYKKGNKWAYHSKITAKTGSKSQDTVYTKKNKKGTKMGVYCGTFKVKKAYMSPKTTYKLVVSGPSMNKLYTAKNGKWNSKQSVRFTLEKPYLETP